jgi:methionyl-tRNA formyltransferase
MQRAIIDGEKVTGVTTQLMAQGIDTGDILEKAYADINENDNFEDIHDRLSLIGADLIVSTVKKLSEGLITPEPQDHSLATHAAKIEKEDCRIDFSLPASIVSARIRGVTPIPGAFTYLNGRMLKLSGVKAVDGSGKAGEVLSVSGVGAGGITVACGEGAILVMQVIPEGKGKMTAGDFVRGRKINKGDILG